MFFPAFRCYVLTSSTLLPASLVDRVFLLEMALLFNYLG